MPHSIRSLLMCFLDTLCSAVRNLQDAGAKPYQHAGGVHSPAIHGALARNRNAVTVP